MNLGPALGHGEKVKGEKWGMECKEHKGNEKGHRCRVFSRQPQPTLSTLQGGPTNWHTIFARINFTKYQPIFKIVLLSESGENS